MYIYIYLYIYIFIYIYIYVYIYIYIYIYIVDIPDFCGFIDNLDLDKIATLGTKAELKAK